MHAAPGGRAGDCALQLVSEPWGAYICNGQLFICSLFRLHGPVNSMLGFARFGALVPVLLQRRQLPGIRMLPRVPCTVTPPHTSQLVYVVGTRAAPVSLT